MNRMRKRGALLRWQRRDASEGSFTQGRRARSGMQENHTSNAFCGAQHSGGRATTKGTRLERKHMQTRPKPGEQR